MNWTELTIYTSREGIEPLTGMLMNLGITGFVVQDPDDMKEFIQQNSDMWDLVDEDVYDMCSAEPNIKMYISDDDEGLNLIRSIYDAAENVKAHDEKGQMGSMNITVQNVEDEDWANNWKKFFKPFTVGKNFVVKPTWETYDNRDDKIILEIDPGNSFGSGQHETTKLCIEALEDYVKRNDTVIDVGCGSGILTVTAAKLHAGKVIGIDIDESAVATATECVKLNHTDDVTTVIRGDLATDIREKADVIIGNLFANIISRLTPDVKRVLKKGGYYITSGIITDTLEDVKNTYRENGITILQIRDMGDWHAVIGQNK